MTGQELVVFYREIGFTVDVEKSGGKKNAYFSESLLTAFRKDAYQTLYAFGFQPPDASMSPSLSFLHAIGRAFVTALTQDSALTLTRAAKPADDRALLALLHGMPFMVGMEHINILWLRTVWDRLRAVFDGEIARTDQSVADYLREKDETLRVAGRVYFHLVEHKSPTHPFAFLATYCAGEAGKVNHLPLKNALLEFANEQPKLLALLSTVSRAADQSNFISEMVESGELFSPLQFTAAEAYTFLREIPLYENCGILCRIPDWWKRKAGARVRVSIGETEPSVVGMQALVGFQPSLYLGDLEITREEAEALRGQTAGLAYLKGKWVEADPQRLKAALEAFDRVAAMDEMTLAEAMRMQLQPESTPAFDGADAAVELTNGQWLRELRGQLQSPREQEIPPPGEDFRATLRPYQQTGYAWLRSMRGLGFGALLADDMGLGKTVQILALLESLRREQVKTLLVIPASLMTNWQKEADRFTPKLRYRLIHTGQKEFALKEADLFITTYGMAARLEGLAKIRWDLVILDEAQAIKSPAAKQTRAIKALSAKAKFAMTGTPIENRLSDLWSLFDCLNPGLLGSAKEFTDFTKSLKENSGNYARLREVVGPFVLRRLKTDKQILSDLPEKVEIKAYASLTRKQALLYNALVEELKAVLQGAEGIERKGLVLTSIMKFKQICNHPDHYMGQSAYKRDQSGKFALLAEICATILEKRERVLVFTQFYEMTGPLDAYLAEIFGRKGLTLHGRTPVKKRGALVERFNDSDEYIPYMVLSLKAGGVGLNLTGANHVIHFDRWWNPAVENQATDRAFRIGQTKNVMVHKFISSGTIEEKIDRILTEKQALADDVIAAGGERWVTEMSDEELMNLVRLEG